jgi:rhamnose transport system substrate-binding protein
MNRTTLALLALVTIFAVGCNREPDASASSTTGSAGPAAAGKKLKIVYIPKNSGNPYFDEVNRGFKEAADALNCDFSTNAPATGEATSQIPIIKEQIQQGVDVIAISANSPDALNQVLDEAKSKGITVITVDADLAGNESHRDAAVLPANFDDIGPGQVELLGSMIGYEGDIAILSATTDAPNQNAWIAKMKETLAQPKYAKMHLVDTVYGDDKPDKSTTEAEGLLAKYPNLRGIISPTSVGLAAAAPVIERAGVYPGGPKAVGKGLQLTGLSTPKQLAKFVQDGSVTSFQLWAPYNEGYIAVELAQQIHDGKLKPAAGGDFESKKFGKQKFTSKLELYGSPLQTFDKKNISDFNF